MNSKIVAGIIADLIVSNYNANLLEKISFRNGTRYTISIETSKTTIQVHIVGKENKLFIEFWHPSIAEPLIILDYDLNREPKQVYEELRSLINIIWGKLSLRSSSKRL